MVVETLENRLAMIEKTVASSSKTATTRPNRNNDRYSD